MKFLVTGGSGFIGINLIEELLEKGHDVLDLSHQAPMKKEHHSLWREMDILDAEKLLKAFIDFSPDIVIHLAARTECDENTTVEKGYRMNTDGTANVLAAIRATPSIQRVVITSSQFVSGPARLPKDELDYFPHTVYGQSKVITEQLTRSAGLTCCWTIIRPTNIWGPWHKRYSEQFWRVASKGIYFHPAGKPVMRCYGYVKTVADQIIKILELPTDKVNAKTLYVGDAPSDIYIWANSFCLALCGRKAPKVPRPILHLAGIVGDVISRVRGKEFYITSSRYRSMISDYVTPMNETFALLGQPTRSLEEGVAVSAKWFRQHTGSR